MFAAGGLPDGNVGTTTGGRMATGALAYTITTTTSTRIQAPRRAIHTCTGTRKPCTLTLIGRTSTIVTTIEGDATVVPRFPCHASDA